MDKDIIAQEINAEYLKGYIYSIKGVRVMLDMDLAKIYGYSTKDFNRQVKNNIKKFEQDFMFQLSDEECEILRCKNSTSSWGGRRYNPYAFTEQGIYMLMTVLKGDLATKQSKALIRIFNAIIHFGTEQHKSLFAPSEAADIKSVMQEYGETSLAKLVQLPFCNT